MTVNVTILNVIIHHINSVYQRTSKHVRGMIKRFSTPCTSSYQGMKFDLFNLVSLQGNALNPSLIELSYPFKIEGLFLVPQILVYCLYDAFIASILCTTNLGFQFWEQIIGRRSHITRIWGVRKDFKSTFSRSSHGNLWHVGSGVILQEQSTTSFPHLFLAVFWCSRLNSPA